MNVEGIEQEDGTLRVLFDGNALTCSVCGNQGYREHSYLLNTQSGELLGSWADDKATNFVCTRCGYVFWFLIRDMKRSKSGRQSPDLSLVDRIFGQGHS